MKAIINLPIESRRRFIGKMGAMGCLSMMPGMLKADFLRLNIPDSNFRGVQIGVIAPFSFRGLPGSADDVLGYLLKTGLSSVELMSSAFETYAGAPASQQSFLPRGTQLTPEQQAEMQANRARYNQEIRKWRLAATMSKYEELRKRYNGEGVAINLVKFDSFDGSMPPEEIDYCFNTARAMGARAITTGLTDENKARLLGPFADKHKMWVGLHNQNHIVPESLDAMLGYGKYMGLNFDLGHHTAGSDIPLSAIIERYKDRIVSLHLTDRTKSNLSVPFGEGDTPLKEILLECADRKYPFGADIDLEYQIPEGSDALKEVQRCVGYCRNALL